MHDLQSPKAICAKGFLFLILGIGSSALLLWQSPTLKTAALLAVAIWAFCRAYYFAFYVVSNYVDRTYRYAGLLSLVRHAVSRRRAGHR